MGTRRLELEYLRRKLSLLRERDRMHYHNVNLGTKIREVIRFQVPAQALLLLIVLVLEDSVDRFYGNMFSQEVLVIFYVACAFLIYLLQVLSLSYFLALWNTFLESKGLDPIGEGDDVIWRINHSLNRWVDFDSVFNIMDKGRWSDWWSVPYYLELGLEDMKAFLSAGKRHAIELRGQHRSFVLVAFVLVLAVLSYSLHMISIAWILLSILLLFLLLPGLVTWIRRRTTSHYRTMLMTWEPWIGPLDRDGKTIEEVREEFVGRIMELIAG